MVPAWLGLPREGYNVQLSLMHAQLSCEKSALESETRDLVRGFPTNYVPKMNVQQNPRPPMHVVHGNSHPELANLIAE